MKRNQPPDRSVEIAEEYRLIEDRLSELYPTSRTTEHKISINKKGHYVREFHHVRLDSSVKLHSMDGLVQYSDALNYHYLKPYQALYLLDTRQLIIFLDELPVSLAEAFKLLLRERADLINYSVFCFLNRNAHFCLEPEALLMQELTQEKVISECILELGESSNFLEENPTKPLFRIDQVHCTYDKILTELCELGPKNLAQSEHACDCDFVVVFDVYRRETFAKKKPRRGKRGTPDYFVVVCDDHRPNSPSSTQLANFGFKYGEDARRKLLFALVDSDNTMSFVHFEPIHPTDLRVNHQAWPEQLSASKLPAANQF